MLAAAAVQVFPNTILVGGSEHLSGFYYDFAFPFAFQKEMLPLLEEKMRTLIKRGDAIALLEMVPENAAQFLVHRGQKARAESALRHIEPLIEIFQIEEFVDICPGPYLSATNEIKAFRLYDATELGGNTVRIWGTAFFSLQELKDYFRGKSKEKPPASHIEIGQQCDLFSPYGEGGWRWHPKGEQLKQFLLNLWREEHEKEGFQFLSTPRVASPEELTAAHLDFVLKRPSITFPFKIAEINHFTEVHFQPGEGLLRSRDYSADRAHIFSDEETLLQNTISSLQFMRKFSTLFPFELKGVLYPSQKKKKQLDLLKEALKASQIDTLVDERKKALHGPEVHFVVQDYLGRKWTGPYLRLECLLLEKVGFSGALIVQGLFPSLERWIALLLEKTQGHWSFDKGLLPEQIN